MYIVQYLTVSTYSVNQILVCPKGLLKQTTACMISYGSSCEAGMNLSL